MVDRRKGSVLDGLPALTILDDTDAVRELVIDASDIEGYRQSIDGRSMKELIQDLPYPDVMTALYQLDRRHVQLLIRRYGLDGQGKRTYTEISREAGLNQATFARSETVQARHRLSIQLRHQVMTAFTSLFPINPADKRRMKESAEIEEFFNSDLVRRMYDLVGNTRVVNVLRYRRINSVEQLTGMSRDDLLRIRGVGPKKVAIIEQALSEYGLKLKE